MSDIKSITRTSRQSNALLNYMVCTSLEVSKHRPCISPLLIFQTSDSLPYVFRRLSEEGILSAPVSEGSQYRGFLTMFDIVNFVTNLFWGSNGEEWKEFMDNHKEWKEATVYDLMETPLWRGRQTISPVYTSNSTFHCLEKLAVCGAHRCAVLSEGWPSKIVNIMTQSMLISEIRQRASMLGSLRMKRAEDMTDFYEIAQTITEDSTAMNAFIRMRDSNVHGLAVEDADGVLTGSISVRDLRGIGTDGPYFSRLFTTVKHFKQTCKRDFPFLGPRAHYYVGGTPLTGIYVTPSATFEDILTKLADGCIHRIFVCSEESVQQGAPRVQWVITQTDVLRQVLKHFAFPAATSEVEMRG